MDLISMVFVKQRHLMYERPNSQLSCSLFMLMLKFKAMGELDLICVPGLLRNWEIRSIVFHSRNAFLLIFLKRMAK